MLQRRKTKVAMLSILSNSLLIVLKLSVGLMINSVSIISEAIHSGVDLLAAIIAFIAVKASAKPADIEHPYGHGKFENLSGTIEALLIFLAAAWIIYEALAKLLLPVELSELNWGIAVMLLSSAVNTVVSKLLFKVGKESDSVALLADAWHLRTDVYTSLGVMASLSLIVVGEKIIPGSNLRWLDPAAAMIVALLIIRAAYHLTINSAKDLLDARISVDEEAWIKSYLSNLGNNICGFHDIRTRKAGSDIFVDFHLLVNPGMSVEESHRIADSIEHDIQEHFKASKVIIHIEPAEDSRGLTLPN